ncbi:MAG: GNAT family N-acetyltransferase [Candidatus Andeanibacterium colombiense]|uniref:GNAT family N-acetyltransferase n=1 Tax=Candidatus Andeanibacterium colombiense TaxID=3121345 RepID=A0AAJ5X7P3_9SPHN|nr:MAG: GNAT family N-acetyltransferase [Sphingomonadaceae bacterium]
MDGVTITHTDEGDHGTYYAHVEGSRFIGRLEWSKHDNVKVVEHTVVPPEIGGRGIAAVLLDALIADARAHGFKIDPKCSYAAAKFARHPEWADLVG